MSQTEYRAKTICLGTNFPDTHFRTERLAQEDGSINHGLLSEIHDVLQDDQFDKPGYYHSSVYDIEFGKLIAVCNLFDQVIMLDQPVQEWTHPDAFLNTLRVLQSVKVPVRYLDPTFPHLMQTIQKLVIDNPSFCFYPFLGMFVDGDHTTICCRSDKKIVDLDQLKDFQSDQTYIEIRNNMVQGNRMPDHCDTCYKLENLGLISARIQETVEWGNRLRLYDLKDWQQVAKPVYYEIRVGNKCNLHCRMCRPHNSHVIEKEYRKIGLIDQFPARPQSKIDSLSVVDLTAARKIRITGGEPLIMQETYDFFERCVSEGRTDTEIIITTNATKLSSKFKKVLKNFSNIQFMFSIDGLGSLNHYIRWPSDWDTIVQNWQYLVDQNHKVMVNTTISIYNVHRLYQLYQFIDQKFGGTLTHCQIVKSPEYLSPLLFPDQQQALDSLKQVLETDCARNDFLFAKNIQSCIDLFEKRTELDQSSCKKFFVFNDKLDASRNIHLKDFIPELEKFRNVLTSG
jgi:sulfatase maturation enzyme AslB (radical SAM superfamily)